MSNVAIIPARSGSKRVPDKNVRDFLGTPMIVRTIATLKESKLFDRIIVSTDSVLYQDLVIRNGAECDKLRPMELSLSHVNTIDVMSFVTNQYSVPGDANVCCVSAPNPFLRVDALTFGLEVLQKNIPVPNYVTTVSTYPFPVQRSLKVLKNNLLTMAQPEFMLSHSQSLEPRYFESNQFWWGKAQTWAQKTPWQTNVSGIYVPPWLCQDIDTEDDWIEAEVKHQIIHRIPYFTNYRIDMSNLITYSTQDS